MEYKTETMAKAQLKDAAISFKSSIMIAKQLRGMMSDKAEALLVRVTEKQQPIKFSRFRDGAGHRSGFGAAKYPVKAATAFLQLVKNGVANAENKGLGVPLKIVSVIPNQASRPVHQGSARGNLMKRTHVEMIFVETEESKKREKKSKPKKSDAKKSAKTEAKAQDKPEAAPEPKADKPAAKPAQSESKPKTEVKAEAKKEPAKPAEKETPKAKEAQ